MRSASKHTFQAPSPQPVEFQSAPRKERWIHLSESSFKVLQCPFQCVFVSVICVKRRSDGLHECMLWVCTSVLCIHEGLLESWSWHGCLACHLEILWSMQPDSSREKNKQQHISELLKVGSDESAHKFCLPFTPQQIKQVLAGAEYNKGILWRIPWSRLAVQTNWQLGSRSRLGGLHCFRRIPKSSTGNCLP